MAAAKKDGFEEFDFSKVKKPFPDNISGFSEQFQEAIINAAGIEKLMDEKLPLDNPDICPIITPAELSRFDPQIGGMRRRQETRGRRKAESAPQQRDLGSGSEEEDPNVPSELDVPSGSDDAGAGAEDLRDGTDSGSELIRRAPRLVKDVVQHKKRALEEITAIPETDDREAVIQQAEEIGARLGRILGMTPEEEADFVRRAVIVRDGMIEARGIKKRPEQIRLEEEAEARNERLRQLLEIPPSERTPEQENEISEAQRENRRLEQLQAERREDQYYFIMAAVWHAVGAIYIGMNMYHALVLNSFGDMMRSLMSQANLGMACGATLSSVFYNADCPSVTRMTQVMWGSIFFVIGSGAIYLGIKIEDRTNIFSILAGLTMYSIDSLKSLFKVMGGVQTTIETGVSTSVGFAGRTVGGIILWPLTRVVNVCRRGFGYEPLRKEKEKEKGGRKRRRTMKHKRKTRGKKGKKMRKTKNKRNRGSRKKQRGGQCGPMKHPNMTDLYRPNPSAMGGKKRRKGRKGKKTRGKTKRRYGKKRGTRKH